MNPNEHFTSLVQDGCYYVYKFMKSTILTKVNYYSEYQGGWAADDILVLEGMGEPMAMWEFFKVIENGGIIEIVEFYPDKDAMMKTYGEYFV